MLDAETVINTLRRVSRYAEAGASRQPLSNDQHLDISIYSIGQVQIIWIQASLNYCCLLFLAVGQG